MLSEVVKTIVKSLSAGELRTATRKVSRSPSVNMYTSSSNWTENANQRGKNTYIIGKKTPVLSVFWAATLLFLCNLSGKWLEPVQINLVEVVFPLYFVHANKPHTTCM